MTDTKRIKFEESSGNVFADLGLSDADELFTRAQIGVCLATGKFWSLSQIPSAETFINKGF